jgi:hypothetical protein
MGTEAVKDSRFLMWNRITLQRLTTCYPRVLQNMLSITEVYLDWAADSQLPDCPSSRCNLSFYPALVINLRKTTWFGLSNSAIRPASTLATMISPASVLTLPKIPSLCIFKAWCWLSSVGLK